MTTIYDIDYAKLIRWLLPFPLRKPRIIAYLSAAYEGVNFTYQNFLRFRKAKLYELSITPQVWSLEKLLNDKYDYTIRRIRIVDAIDRQPLYLYKRVENKPVYFYMRAENKPNYLYTRGEVNEVQQNDFVVLVPSDLLFNKDEMTSLIKLFKLASKNFAIQKI